MAPGAGSCGVPTVEVVEEQPVVETVVVGVVHGQPLRLLAAGDFRQVVPVPGGGVADESQRQQQEHGWIKARRD